MLARRSWIGRDVQCPYCQSTLRMPEPGEDGRPAYSLAPSIRAKRSFNFSCARCGCLLEGHTGMSGQRGSCPTCAAHFIVPFVDPRTGAPDATRLLDEPPEAPTPMHAYAASGAQAPQIEQQSDGSLRIVCPRCRVSNAIEADACASCGAPFTMDAAPTVERVRLEGWALASLILGLTALPTCMLFVPGLLAIVFGSMAMFARGPRARRNAAIGAALGVLSIVGGLIVWGVFG